MPSVLPGWFDRRYRRAHVECRRRSHQQQAELCHSFCLAIQHSSAEQQCSVEYRCCRNLWTVCHCSVFRGRQYRLGHVRLNRPACRAELHGLMGPCDAIRNRGEMPLWPLSLRDQRLSIQVRRGQDEFKINRMTYFGSIGHFSDNITGSWIDHFEYVATRGVDKFVVDKKLRQRQRKIIQWTFFAKSAHLLIFHIWISINNELRLRCCGSRPSGETKSMLNSLAGDQFRQHIHWDLLLEEKLNFDDSLLADSLRTATYSWCRSSKEKKRRYPLSPYTLVFSLFVERCCSSLSLFCSVVVAPLSFSSYTVACVLIDNMLCPG